MCAYVCTSVHVCVCISMCVHVCVHMCVHVYMCVYMCACVYIHVCMCMCVYVYVFACVYCHFLADAGNSVHLQTGLVVERKQLVIIEVLLLCNVCADVCNMNSYNNMPKACLHQEIVRALGLGLRGAKRRRCRLRIRGQIAPAVLSRHSSLRNNTASSRVRFADEAPSAPYCALCAPRYKGL